MHPGGLRLSGFDGRPQPKGRGGAGRQPGLGFIPPEVQAKFSLPFPLLSDGSHAIAEAYGAWQEKSMYGRKYMGIVRSTFVIDEEGHIAEVHGKVKVKGHVEALLKSL